MKNSLLILMLLVSSIAMRAQIFINTGNENLEKYKKENPNIEIYDENKHGSQPEKAPATQKPEAEKVKPAAIAVTSPAVTKSTPAETHTATVPAAQPEGAELPPNAEPGKCYARCFISDQFEFKEEQVVDKPLSYKTEVIPAVYGKVTDTVVLRKSYVKKVVTPAEYEVTSEDVLVTPATTKWQKGKADASCLSANPADCQVWCLVEVPAVYRKVTKKVLKTPASSREETIPAELKFVERKVVLEAAKTNKVEVPATYKTVMKKVLVKKGGYQEWREVLCADKLNEQRILAIQKALKSEGYDPGPFDNVFGTKTKEALIKFQQDKGLPVGNLNMETLKALGVN
ncbi:MAG: peptidoglycan-binding protein [Chitinophagales bacterium]|nr:peptidoglycan-binding protein [Chitinophagales bacterium]